MPAQSGSSSTLERMRRGYTRDSYLQLIQRTREIIPNCPISSDFISGFCGETEDEHKDTLSLLQIVKFSQAFMFAYSLREKTHAHRNYIDDIPHEVKIRRLTEVIDTFTKEAIFLNKQELSKQHLVLVEGLSKRSDKHLFGRTDSNKVVIFENIPVVCGSETVNLQSGDYAVVRIESCSPHTLQGTAVMKTTQTDYFNALKH